MKSHGQCPQQGVGQWNSPDIGLFYEYGSPCQPSDKRNEEYQRVSVNDMHTTDFMKGHPTGTIHITCLVPKDHKRTDMPLGKVDFDISQLPKNKDTPIMTYCASDTWWKSYHAARLAVANGYQNVYWMRDGINGWKNAGYSTVGKLELLNDLIDVNKIDFGALLVTEKDAKNLKNCTFVDFRDKSKYDKNHIEGANHVDYGNGNYNWIVQLDIW